MGVNGIFDFNVLIRSGLLLGPLLLRIQEALRDASRSICSAANPSTQNMTPSVLSTGEALYLAIRVGVVVVETSAWITIPSGMICDDAKRCRGRFCNDQ
jgi:hypothetical protein